MTAEEWLRTFAEQLGAPAPTQEEMDRMGRYIEESMKAGELVATEGCLPSALGARVRSANGKVTVTDGPFTESKELVAGFALLQTASKQEAIDLCKKFLDVAGEGECEIRQIVDASDFGPDFERTEEHRRAHAVKP